MRRHPALQDLSRDHHPTLLHARRLRGEDPRIAPDVARRRFLLFYEAVVRFHFQEEDVALVPFIRQADLKERLVREHAELRGLVQELPQASQAFQHDLGERLRAHVRFEEDVLFQQMQQDLTPPEWEQLTALATTFRGRVRPASLGSGAHEECFV